jgi:ribose 5-phosphate isomerase B
MNNSLILFASDHRGYELKSKLIVWAAEQGYATKDLGPDSVERCDAGDFATRLATELKSKPSQFGVLCGGSGSLNRISASLSGAPAGG